MNSGTKREDRQNLVLSTGNSVQWVSGNGRTTLLIGGIAALILVVLAVGYAIFQHRTAEAQTAFGQAMEIYQTPLVRPDQPLPPGMKAFNTAAERAAKANTQFVTVAQQYGMTEPGKLALYFAGLTYGEAGKNGPAEETLEKVSKSWNGDIAALGKMALAQLDQQTGRREQAVVLYQELAKGHATTVPPGLAQLQLAALYSAEGRTEESRHIYAELKDHDKDAAGKAGVAAQVATERLNPAPTPGPALPPR